MADGPNRFLLVANVLLLAVGAALLAQGSRTSDRAAAAASEAAAARRSALAAEEQGRALAASVEGLRGDLDVLATNVGAVERNLARVAEDLVMAGSGLGGGLDPTDVSGAAPAGQPFIEFSPELKQVLAATLAEKGVTLTEDRVVFPGRVALRQGNLEFFAVFPGGKTHESIFLLTGRPAKGDDGEPLAPQGLAAGLNSALMALGLKPGTPLRILPGGKTLPPTGTPVNVYVEWDEAGSRERVRGEDLLWDLQRGRTLEHGRFLYVGSYFEPEGYVPDLTGDAVAVYSIRSCVVDLSDPRAADDTIFAPCTPRIPVEGTPVDVVFTALELPTTKSWDPEKPSVRTDGGGAATEAGGGR